VAVATDGGGSYMKTACGVLKSDGLYYNGYVEMTEEAWLASERAFEKPKNISDPS